jgi:hypothetical protein
MDREQSWQVITEQRLGLARLLEGLSDSELDPRRRYPGAGELSPAQP